MISGEQIKRYVERLVAAANPSKVILFGSCALGDATEDSDLDLMVIEQEAQNAGEKMARLHRAAGDVGKGMDVLVYSDREASRSSQVPGSCYTVRSGKVLYDARH